MRNTVFICIIAVLVIIQVAPQMYKTLEEWKEAKEEKKREYRSKQLHDDLKKGQKARREMQRYCQLREKEKAGYALNLDESRELNTITDNLGYWFERQGKKLTKCYGLNRFNQNEIDALVGIK